MGGSGLVTSPDSIMNITVDHKSAAIALIKQEHRDLARVLHVLQQLAHDIRAEHTAPDFQLLSLVLYYLDDFPRRLHHPKEEDFLFAAVRRRGHDFDLLLDELHLEHLRDARTMRELYRLLVFFQAGAPGALEQFVATLESYAALVYGHMRKEEALLDDPALALSEDDWRGVADAFRADDDPLFGPTPRREFVILHHRIMNLLPRKMRTAHDVDAR